MLINTHGHIDRFTAILVAYKDAVVAGVFHSDFVDGEGAALGLLGDVVLVSGDYFSVIFQPEHLWRWISVGKAGETQGLLEGGNIGRDKT